MENSCIQSMQNHQVLHEKIWLQGLKNQLSVLAEDRGNMVMEEGKADIGIPTFAYLLFYVYVRWLSSSFCYLSFPSSQTFSFLDRYTCVVKNKNLLNRL